MAYYENSQWPAGGQSGWEHQTPPVRSGASSAVPREEAPAFVSQIEEVEKAIDNLVKSGKMFNMPGRRESLPAHAPQFPPGPSRKPRLDYGDNRIPSGPGSRPHSVGGFHDDRSAGPHQGSNLSNFYASQRQQPSRGTNEAEQMMQAKRRMAAQRERELRNYHQEQQYNRTSISDVRPDRTLSPGSNMSEDERRELIARQRSALYGEGQFADGGGYVDETGAVRPGMPGQPQHPSQTIAPPPMGGVGLRGHSPLAYEYGRTPPINADAQPGAPEGSQAANIANDRSRANSNASPQSNSGLPLPQQPSVNRTSNSSPAGSPGNNKPTTSVAPIGTRPSTTAAGSTPPANPALTKQRSTTPAPSPLSQGYTASGNADEKATPTTTAPGSQPTGAPDVSGWGGRSGVWGSKSGLGSVQASVWG
ncbi:hypothetical protein MCOR27_003627 [Pyricularia oryzae]|uniref:Uncharacterized protein n=4 Tax=Pyricularia TaxID=48558 RepID=G5EI80_PYRO7|nr:uncharacterized protein MGG_03109 [Pyricularia oryzae 70-15]KAH8838688.1 hypothetical protein MCOR01_010116 [Pyricularia oryzae]KAI6299436.1 hypothetical protein MCOR33_004676 [Pyricularia grisea]EAQ71506.1 hypothetical protein MGCH7_ch7g913 [Pyricularia oryzae 70-15]EHA45820.1 hypothetical protein MGG_03109 [Pyricularia oryzae 70-15]KAH9436552.1 hypothetical protein MCOR02_000226 [Pyricularia oryzae]